MDRSQGSNQMLCPYPGPSSVKLQCYIDYYVFNVMFFVLCCCHVDCVLCLALCVPFVFTHL